MAGVVIVVIVAWWGTFGVWWYCEVYVIFLAVVVVYECSCGSNGTGGVVDGGGVLVYSANSIGSGVVVVDVW